MQRKIKPARETLAEATERLRLRNDRLEALLNSESPLSRVLNAPETTLDDATERARKFWDSLEKGKKNP